jgi:hypothetical protein
MALNISFHRSWARIVGVLLVSGVVSAFVACSSSSTTSTPAAGGGGATCASPGQATPGAADVHCQGKGQGVLAASCLVQDAGPVEATDGGSADAGATEECPYGDTLFGVEGDDDDCKYHLAWKSDPICQGTAGVNVTVTVTSKADGVDGPAGSPVKGIKDGIRPEVFIPTSTTASCDNQSSHPSPSSAALVETPAGSGVYKGAIVFDAPGQWTVRFHIHEECTDVLETSQHGHAAFHVTVP